MINIVTKLAKDVHILKSRKGVPIAARSPSIATPPVASTPSVAGTPPPVTRVPIDATPPVGATSSYANTPNMLTNDGYCYNYNEDRVPNDGNDGHTHSSPTNEDKSTPMEMDEVVGIIGEPLDAGVAIKAPMEGNDKGGGVEKVNSEKDCRLQESIHTTMY